MSVWTADIVVALASAALLLWIFVFYYNKARKMTSSFSVGLASFAAIFLVQNLLAVVFYFQLARTYPVEVALPMLALNGLSLAAFATLAWLIRR